MDKAFEYLDYEQGSDSWLEMRLNHITASNVPAIMGACPYKTAFQYGTELLTKQPDDAKASYIFRKGHQSEAHARAWCQKTFEMDLPARVVRSLQHPYLVASLDGIHEEQGIIFESKLVSTPMVSSLQERTDSIPINHYIQMQTQLLITGFKQALYFAVDTVGNNALMTLAPDAQMQDQILEKTKEFWETIQNGELPQASDRDVRIVQDARFDELNKLHQILEELTPKYEELKRVLCRAYPDAFPVRSQCGVSIRRYWQRGEINWASYMKNAGIEKESVEQFRKPGGFRTRFKFKKETKNEN